VEDVVNGPKPDRDFVLRPMHSRGAAPDRRLRVVVVCDDAARPRVVGRVYRTLSAYPMESLRLDASGIEWRASQQATGPMPIECRSHRSGHVIDAALLWDAALTVLPGSKPLRVSYRRIQWNTQHSD
jgi:hypothetical protein